jgi:hypothetical protein
LAVTNEGRVYQWGKLYKLGDTKQYFGGVIGLTGMKDSSRLMIDKSHKLYYDGMRFIGDQIFLFFSLILLSMTISHSGTGKKEKVDDESESNQNFGTFTPYLQKVPVLVEGLEDVKIVSVAAGYSYSLAVSGLFYNPHFEFPFPP